MLKTDQLLGRTFDWNTAHCYHLVRDFHRDNFGMDLTNYACPAEWWDKGGNLFMDNYFKEGFQVFDKHPREIRPGMVTLLAIRASVANHCGILLAGEKILHHLIGQVSCIESYNRPLFRNHQMAVVYHPEIDYESFGARSQIDAMDLLPPQLRRRLDESRLGTEPSDV